MPTKSTAFWWEVQSSVGQTYPNSPAFSDPTTVDDFDPFTPLPGNWSFSFGTATYAMGLDALYDATGTGGGWFCGEAMALEASAAAEIAASSWNPDQPLGPIEVMWSRNGAPYESTITGVVIADTIVGVSTWTTDPLDNVLVTPLDSDGSDLSAAVALSSLAVEEYRFWAVYDFSLSGIPDPGWRTASDVPNLATPCYGIRLEHADPGYDYPIFLALRSVFLDFVPLTPIYLRQRQSPRANPRVSFQRTSLRQRQCIP